MLILSYVGTMLGMGALKVPIAILAEGGADSPDSSLKSWGTTR
jgi:hypothetical protein